VYLQTDFSIKQRLRRVRQAQQFHSCVLGYYGFPPLVSVFSSVGLTGNALCSRVERLFVRTPLPASVDRLNRHALFTASPCKKIGRIPLPPRLLRRCPPHHSIVVSDSTALPFRRSPSLAGLLAACSATTHRGQRSRLHKGALRRGGPHPLALSLRAAQPLATGTAPAARYYPHAQLRGIEHRVNEPPFIHSSSK
jgi:hypothetical protein